MKYRKWNGLDDFFERLRYKSIYLFGAGIQGERMGKFLMDRGYVGNLCGYIDNKKAGQYIKIDDIDFYISPLDKVENIENTIIIITSFATDEIYEQLKTARINGLTEVYSYKELAENVFEDSNYTCVIRDYFYPVIPRKIHYVWVGGEKPKAVKDNIDNWKRFCQDYEFIEWNENNYDMNKVAYIKEAYENKAYGYVPDYLRLDVIFKYGGIYLDTDIELKKSLDELLYQNCFGCVDSSLTLNLGSGFGAKPRCETIREFRDYYNDIHFCDNDGSIDRRSCNSHQYEVLRRGGYQISDQFQKFKEMNIYPAIFQGRDSWNEKTRVSKKTFWIHWGNLSWFKGC